MTQEELKDYIISRITKNKEFWSPRIETFFNETPDVTREKMDVFFRELTDSIRSKAFACMDEYVKANNIREPFTRRDEFMKYDQFRRNKGLIPLEEIVGGRNEVEMALDEQELAELHAEMEGFAHQFRINAVEAFNKNERYTCAIYYTLLMIALNKELKDTLADDFYKDFLDPPYIKRFLMERVFAPSLKVTAELSLDESQKKDVVDSIFNRASGFGRYIARLDFSMVENNNLPFETSSHGITFFDFIGICKNRDIWPDIRKIY